MTECGKNVGNDGGSEWMLQRCSGAVEDGGGLACGAAVGQGMMGELGTSGGMVSRERKLCGRLEGQMEAGEVPQGVVRCQGTPSEVKCQWG